MFKKINAKKIKKLTAENGNNVFDVRTAVDYRDWHLDGVKNIPINMLIGKLQSFANKSIYLIIDKMVVGDELISKEKMSAEMRSLNTYAFQLGVEVGIIDFRDLKDLNEKR